jgi:DNA-binding response OmpR family regulator
METSEVRVVLAEDDRFMRRAAEAALRKSGYTVLSATDGEEALSLVRSETPDVVVLDMILPKLQGFEVLQSLKQDRITADIPVIVLSSLAQEEDQHEAMSRGAAAYLVKSSLSLRELSTRVTEAVQVRRNRLRETL